MGRLTNEGNEFGSSESHHGSELEEADGELPFSLDGDTEVSELADDGRFDVLKDEICNIGVDGWERAVDETGQQNQILSWEELEHALDDARSRARCESESAREGLLKFCCRGNDFWVSSHLCTPGCQLADERAREHRIVGECEEL